MFEGSPYVVVANVLDCDIIVSEFELQFRFTFTFRFISLGKVWTPTMNSNLVPLLTF